MQATRLGASIWDPAARELRRDGDVLELTALEARLLGYLAERPGRTVASDELLREVWEYAPRVRTRAVASTVTRLRTKLAEDASALVTVYGRGYRLLPRGDADLVGREELLARVRHTLEARRWVTLFGLGGVGKTRVARAVAEGGGRRTLWVPCGAMRADSELWSAMAGVLELPGSAEPRVIRRTLDALGPTCLVLDAAEHLGVSGAAVAQIMVVECPQLYLIATSRFHHGDGAAIRVEPLDAASAEALFVRRVRAVQTEGFEPEPEALRTVVDQVEGLPLGIELAAARMRLFDLASLAEHMQVDPHIVDRKRDSIQAVLEQSWALLSSDERCVLAAAAQFPESFTVELVQTITELEPRRMLDALEGLVRAALVLDRQPRFRMLDLVRSFGAAKADAKSQRAFERWCVSAAQDLWAKWLRGDVTMRDTPGYPVSAFGPVLERLDGAEDRAWLALGTYAHESRHGTTRHLGPLLRDLSVEGLEPRLTASVRLVQAWAAYTACVWDEAAERAREGRAAASAAGETELALRCWQLVVAVPLATGAVDESLFSETAGLEEAVGRASRAERAPADALGADQACARALHVCGVLRASTGQLAEGVALYQRALSLAGDNAVLKLGITAHVGFAYRQLCRLDLAVEVLDEAWRTAKVVEVGMPRLSVGMRLAEVLAADQRWPEADAVQAALAELGAHWGDAASVLGADIWQAHRETDPMKRETALQRVAERALRDRCAEEVGRCEQLRGHSLHDRGEVSAAVAAYTNALTHLAPFGQLFNGTVTQTWRALAELELGSENAGDVSLLDAPSPLEATLVSLVELAAAADWPAVDRVAAQASDDTVHKTVALIGRLR